MNFKRAAAQKKQTDTEKQAPAREYEEIAVPLWMKVVIVLFALVVFGGGITIYVLGSNVYDFVKNVQDDPLSALLDFAGSELQTDQFGRTNVLLLGGGGQEGYDEGSDLTDSIILVSINKERDHVTLISLPRDLVVIVPETNEYHRINTLFPLGRKKFGESGKDTLVRAAIENALCLEIQYYAKIDFSGFMKVVDALGGVDVEVERQFTDYQYPAENYAYQTVHFDAGPQHMDGQTALEFSRSRHGTNGEASDFARAARQQRLLQALWQKAQSLNMLESTKQLQDIMQTVNEHYETDLKLKEMLTLAGIGKQMLMPKNKTDQDGFTIEQEASLSDKITTIVMDDGPGGLLYTPTEEVRAQYYGGAFVLLPDGDNFDTICAYVNRMLVDPFESEDLPTIEVLNGSGRGFLARDVGAFLVRNGYNVTRRDNTFQQRKYETSYLYDQSRGGNITTLMDLQKLLSMEVVPDNTEPVFFNDIDVTIVLGADFKFPEGALGAPTLKSEQRAAPINELDTTPEDSVEL